MSVLEVLTINLAASALRTTAKLWLKDHEFAQGASIAVVDVFKKKIDDFETRHSTSRLFEGLQDEIGRRLDRLIDIEFRAVPEHERTAAALAVAGVFDTLSLPASLLKTDLDAARLEGAARPAAEQMFKGLGEDTRALAALLLRESCNYIVTLAGKMPDFHVAATREILARHTVLLAELNKVLDALAAMRANTAFPESLQARDFELQYRRALDQRLNRMELFGVRLVGGARVYPLTVAYVSLTATGEHSKLPVRVDDALAGKRRIVVRGEAGSGKTTLLRWLAVRSANRDFSGTLSSWNTLLPFYLSLRNYAGEPFPQPEQFINHIADNFVAEMPKGWCHSALRKGALLLVDGIDELPAARRKEFAAWLEVILADFSDVIAVVSSRPAALSAEKPVSLDTKLVDCGFALLDLQPMTLSDSETLVAQWHATVARDSPDKSSQIKLEQYERDLRQILRERSAVRNLAATPLLCAMICALNWDRRRRVPDDRLELYRVALEMLLEARDIERGVNAVHVQGLDRKTKEELLDAIAYWMLRNDLKEADRSAVEKRVNEALPRLSQIRGSSGDVLQELLERTGILREPQHGVIGWVHRTFMEYMGARAAIAVDDIPLLANQAKREAWRETLVFAAGHAQGRVRDALIAELLKKQWFTGRSIEAEVTAVCCLETVGSSLDPGLLGQLKKLSRRLFPPTDTAMAQLLAPAAGLEPTLLEGHAAAGSTAVAACIRAAAIVGGPRMLEVIAGYTDVPGDRIDSEITQAWLAFDPEEFFEKVIKRRPRFLRLSPLQLEREQVMCLKMLIDLGELPPPYEKAEEYLDSFKRFRKLSIQNAKLSGLVENDADNYNALPAPIQSTETSPAARTPSLSPASIRQIAQLRSLEHLVLPDLHADIVPLLADLTHLKSLAFGVNRRCSMDWLPKLKGLESLLVSGDGISDLRVLKNCPLLTSLAVINAASSSLDEIPLTPALRHLKLSYTPLRSLEEIGRAVNLETLEMAGLAPPSPEAFIQLRKLKNLTIGSTASAFYISYKDLPELNALSLRSVALTAISGIDGAARLKVLTLRNVGQDGALPLRLPSSIEELTVMEQTILDLSGIREVNQLRRMRIFRVELISHTHKLLEFPRLVELEIHACPTDYLMGVMSTLRSRGVKVNTILTSVVSG